MAHILSLLSNRERMIEMSLSFSMSKMLRFFLNIKFHEKKGVESRCSGCNFEQICLVFACIKLSDFS